MYTESSHKTQNNGPLSGPPGYESSFSTATLSSFEATWSSMYWKVSMLIWYKRPRLARDSDPETATAGPPPKKSENKPPANAPANTLFTLSFCSTLRSRCSP